MKPPFLNPKRLRYAWITGSALWIGWLASIVLGSGNRDASGLNVGADFLAFYTEGKMLVDGHAAELYNLHLQQEIQQAIVGGNWPDLCIYVNPPFYAWLFVPFAWLPYRTSALIWMALSFLAIGLSVRLLKPAKPAYAFVWALTFMPVFAAVSFGQNTPLVLLLMCITYSLWRRERRFSAGLISSLILFKPQLVVGLGLLWLLEWRRDWKTLTGLVSGGLALVGLSFGLTPGASLDFVRASRDLLTILPPMHAYSTRPFWLNLLPGVPVVPDALYILSVIAGVWLFVKFWRRTRAEPALLFASAICLTLWITPHAMVYEWSLLIIPAILLWERFPQEHEPLKGIDALVWVAALVSSSLTLAQLKALPFSVQISVPVLGYALVRSYHLISAQLVHQQPPRVECPPAHPVQLD